MKSIHTLIPDIYELLGTKGWFSDELAAEFSREVSIRLQGQFTESTRKGLRLSKLGPQCPRAIWYSAHQPEKAEKLPPWTINKFSYGHILEAWAICLAKAAGHIVTGEQDELVLDGIRGHRDCVINGCIVDVKSCSSQTFAKFKDKTIAQSDGFGYLAQLDGYLEGSNNDPLVLDREHAYLLGIDKTLGHMVLYEHKARPSQIRDRVRVLKGIVASDVPPPCECGTVADGESGNRRLDVRASYSDFKWECHPNLRCFLYAGEPRYLTRVVRHPAPHIHEVNKHGQIIA